MTEIETDLIRFAMGKIVVPSPTMPHLNRFGLHLGVGAGSRYVVSFELDEAISAAQKPIGRAEAAGTVATAIADSMIRSGDIDYSVIDLALPTIACVISLQPESMQAGSRALAVGLEAGTRIAMALRERANTAWWDVNAIAGGIGAGLAATRLLGMVDEQQRSALALTVVQAPRFAGRLEPALRRLLVAQTASETLEAVLAARSGITGPDHPITGIRGLFGVLNALDTEFHRLVEGLGEIWRLAEIFANQE